VKKVLWLSILVMALPMMAPTLSWGEDAPTVDLSLKIDNKLNGAVEKRNYVQYFCWLKFEELNLSVASQTRCSAEKWMEKKLKAKKKTVFTAEEAAKVKASLVLNVTVKTDYVALEMSLDGNKTQTGHSWRSTITGTLTDSTGKEIKKIKLRHSWGTNMTIARKRGSSEFMRQLSMWLLLEVLESEEAKKLIADDKKETLKKLCAEFLGQKKKFYDDTWK
jgi:hypothetical protein